MNESTIPRQPEPVIRPELVMLIGLQGAGKTTFAGQRIFATVNRFQSPTIGEGFDELWSVDTFSDLRFEVRP